MGNFANAVTLSLACALTLAAPHMASAQTTPTPAPAPAPPAVPPSSLITYRGLETGFDELEDRTIVARRRRAATEWPPVALQAQRTAQRGRVPDGQHQLRDVGRDFALVTDDDLRDGWRL